MTLPVRRVCVVRHGGMGDILLATPAIRALAEHFDFPDIDFIVGRGMGDTLSGIAYLRTIIEFDKRGTADLPVRFATLLHTIRVGDYDLFVNLHPGAKTAMMALASGARRVVTFRKDRRRQPATGRVRHAVDDFAKELTSLGVPALTDRRLDFVVPESATVRLRQLLSDEFAIRDSDVMLVVNPASTRLVNRWPPELFASLLDRLLADQPRIKVAVTGSATDRPLVQTVVQSMADGSRVADLSGRLTVKELGALLARADCVLTGDTGPMHIASAVGAPIVCLSGAADPDRTGPLNPRDLIVMRTDLDCIPCQAKTCRRHDIACMTGLSVDRVYRDVRLRLAGCAGRALAGHWGMS